MAVPYAGQARRALSQRWADAACLTLDAVLAAAPAVDRAQWTELLPRLGRLRDGHGWAWQVAADDAAGYGASTAWSVVEFAGSGTVRLAAPLVEIGRPIRP
jgi:hypothetical protein